jgi:hypothetical protein
MHAVKTRRVTFAAMSAIVPFDWYLPLTYLQSSFLSLNREPRFCGDVFTPSQSGRLITFTSSL